MVIETDRAWLAGIWDGEGSIALFTNQEKDGCTKIKPVVNMVNTDMGIIDKVLSILEEAECNVYIVRRIHKNPNHKDVIEIKTNSVNEIEKLLLLIEPYLFGIKKNKANILLRYVRRRKERRNEKGRNDLATYTEDDWNDVAEFRSSQTTRKELVQDCTVMI